jgi:hypothetical protein
MNKITKHLISILFTIAACVTAGSAGAQSWSYGTDNCSSLGDYCACPTGYTYAMATGTNCGFDCLGSLCTAGCWNAGTGTCNSCGLGGTIGLGSWACFGGSNGQQNVSNPNPENTSCQQNDQCQGFQASCSSYQGTYCVAWNTPPTNGGTASDIRLKRDIVLLGQTEQGIKLYSFKYLSSDQVYVGVMAQDLLENPKWQDAVITNPSGYYSVNYSKLGLEMVTLEQYQQVSAVALVK